MAQKTLKVSGMTCTHCVMRVKKALDGVAGVKSSEVGIGTAKVSFDESKVTDDDLKAAIEKAGYKIEQ